MRVALDREGICSLGFIFFALKAKPGRDSKCQFTVIKLIALIASLLVIYTLSAKAKKNMARPLRKRR